MYWPEDENKPLRFGEISISLLCKEADDDFRTLSFELRRDKVGIGLFKFQFPCKYTPLTIRNSL